jgi:competence protein ComEA
MIQILRALIPCAAALCLIAATPRLSHAQDQAPAAAPKSTINLNTATVDQLASLPGVGQKTAERIVEYRIKNGGFKKIEELMNVKGIGEKSFLKIKPLVAAPPKADKTSGD